MYYSSTNVSVFSAHSSFLFISDSHMNFIVSKKKPEFGYQIHFWHLIQENQKDYWEKIHDYSKIRDALQLSSLPPPSEGLPTSDYLVPVDRWPHGLCWLCVFLLLVWRWHFHYFRDKGKDSEIHTYFISCFVLRSHQSFKSWPFNRFYLLT